MLLQHAGNTLATDGWLYPPAPAHLLLLLPLPLPVERLTSLALRPAAAALAGNQSLAVVDVG
jgi:hypothetical protein